MTGSNPSKKKHVRKGTLCFICEMNSPDFFWAEFGGYVCASCHATVTHLRLSHAMKFGYHLKGNEYTYDVR